MLILVLVVVAGLHAFLWLVRNYKRSLKESALVRQNKRSLKKSALARHDKSCKESAFIK